jgi:uncharacterized protein
MNVTRELFIIPNEGNFILFAPLRKALLEVNETTVALLQECERTGTFPESDVRRALYDAGIIFDGTEQPHNWRPTSGIIEPDSVTLFPTSDCSLFCRYCYAGAGETHFYLAWPVARAAIDLVFENAVRRRAKKASVGFHGGGEPFYGRAWEVVQRSVLYARELSKRHGIYVSLSAATNGVLSLKKLDWITKHFGNLNISFDGPEDIQNRQRPLKSGKGSFDHVMRTVRLLEERKFSYGIRATITKESVGRLIEMVDFFRSISTLTQYHFEPLFECGRCATTGAEAPDPIEFATAMVDAMQYARTRGIELYYSGANIDRTVDSFCGASGRSFCVTPQGNVTSCFEVSLESDPRAAQFFYGKFDTDTKRFVFQSERVAALQNRTVNNLSHCADCLIKYQCAGDCLAKVHSTGDMFDTSKNTRCSTNHILSQFKMRERLAEMRTTTPARKE